MAKLSAAERQAQIVELLSDNGTMKAVELAERFQVSRETIRRDLIALSETGSIKKLFGSVIPVNDFSVRPIDSRLQDFPEEKLAICKKALEYIPENGVIYLDTGSTVLCFASQLQSKSGLTIITNSISAANALMGSSNQVIMTGGVINSQVSCVCGQQTLDFLTTLRMDVAILGTSGFERHKGPSTNHFEDAQIKKTAINSAQTSIVLTDSRKATYSSLTQYASWRDIDYLITDSGISAQMVQALSEMTTVISA